jgi:hypothetical protein
MSIAVMGARLQISRRLLLKEEQELAFAHGKRN